MAHLDVWHCIDCGNAAVPVTAMRKIVLTNLHADRCCQKSVFLVCYQLSNTILCANRPDCVKIQDSTFFKNVSNHFEIGSLFKKGIYLAPE